MTVLCPTHLLMFLFSCTNYDILCGCQLVSASNANDNSWFSAYNWNVAN